LGRTDSPPDTDPPEPAAPEGFLFPKHGSFEIARRKPERETRIPGLAPRARSPEARGLPEGTRREPDTDGGADLKGLLWRRRFERRDEFLQSGLPHRAARRTLVVKISDTSLQGKRVRIPPLASRTVEAASRGPLRRGRRFLREEDSALASLKADIACSPACCCRCLASARRW